MDIYQGVYLVALLVILGPARCLYNGGELQWTVTKVCTLWPSLWSWGPQDAYIMEVNYNGQLPRMQDAYMMEVNYNE